MNYMVDPLWKNPYSEQYNLGIEQQFGSRTILSLNYVGSASHRMDVGGYYNTGTPAVLSLVRRPGNEHGATVSLYRSAKILGPQCGECILQRAAGVPGAAVQYRLRLHARLYLEQDAE